MSLETTLSLIVAVTVILYLLRKMIRNEDNQPAIPLASLVEPDDEHVKQDLYYNDPVRGFVYLATSHNHPHPYAYKREAKRSYREDPWFREIVHRNVGTGEIDPDRFRVIEAEPQ